MAILTNKGNAQERTVGTIQKLSLVLADVKAMTSGTAATSWTQTLGDGKTTVSVGIPYSAGDRLSQFFYQLVTPFAGGNTTLGMQVGYAGAAATSAAAFLASSEILASGKVVYSSGTGLAYSTVEAGNVSVTMTASTDITALTAGQVDLYITQEYATDLYA